MSRYTVEWDLKITCRDVADFNYAVSEITTNAATRLATSGENWAITQQPESLTVIAALITEVEDIHDAG